MTVMTHESFESCKQLLQPNAQPQKMQQNMKRKPSKYLRVMPDAQGPPPGLVSYGAVQAHRWRHRSLRLRVLGVLGLALLSAFGTLMSASLLRNGLDRAVFLPVEHQSMAFGVNPRNTIGAHEPAQEDFEDGPLRHSKEEEKEEGVLSEEEKEVEGLPIPEPPPEAAPRNCNSPCVDGAWMNAKGQTCQQLSEMDGIPAVDMVDIDGIKASDACCHYCPPPEPSGAPPGTVLDSGQAPVPGEASPLYAPLSADGLLIGGEAPVPGVSPLGLPGTAPMPIPSTQPPANSTAPDGTPPIVPPLPGMSTVESAKSELAKAVAALAAASTPDEKTAAEARLANAQAVLDLVMTMEAATAELAAANVALAAALTPEEKAAAETRLMKTQAAFTAAQETAMSALLTQVILPGVASANFSGDPSVPEPRMHPSAAGLAASAELAAADAVSAEEGGLANVVALEALEGGAGANLGPVWTRGEIETPLGKDGTYTLEQQATLGVDAQGNALPVGLAVHLMQPFIHGIRTTQNFDRRVILQNIVLVSRAAKRRWYCRAPRPPRQWRCTLREGQRPRQHRRRRWRAEQSPNSKHSSGRPATPPHGSALSRPWLRERPLRRPSPPRPTPMPRCSRRRRQPARD